MCVKYTEPSTLGQPGSGAVSSRPAGSLSFVDSGRPVERACSLAPGDPGLSPGSASYQSCDPWPSHTLFTVFPKL